MIPEIPETWVLAYFHESISDHALTYTCRRCGYTLHFGPGTPHANVAWALRFHLGGASCAARAAAVKEGS